MHLFHCDGARRAASAWSLFFLLGLFGAGVLEVRAQGARPEAMYDKLFHERPVQADWFTPEFLAQVPAAQIEAVVDQYVDMLGAYVGAEGSPPEFRLLFERGSAPSQIVVTPGGQIAGLWFGLPEPDTGGGGLQEAVAAFSDLPGEVSVFVVGDSGPLAAVEADTPLAVGSAFKLAVLAALQDQIDRGQARWDDVVVLTEDRMSLPSGVLQQWPPGTPLTVATLATLMISQSDNTAADTLLHYVGRDVVEQYAPRNRPFLATREMFVLKATGNEALLEAYRAAPDPEARRTLLAQRADAPLPGIFDLPSTPTALDVEWYFTAVELAVLMSRVHELPLMGVNPGVASPAEWERIAFKGGSEPGVINLTTSVTNRDGDTFIVVATWNDSAEPLDENLFITSYANLLRTLR